MIELMKLIFLFDIGALSPDELEHKDFGRVFVFFLDGRYIAEYTKNEQIRHVEFDNAFYNEVQEECKEKLAAVGDDCMEIDLTWAHMFISNDKL